MVNFQQEKKLILEFFNDLDSAKNEELVDIIFKYTSDNFYMRCTHPFNEIKGAENVAKHLPADGNVWITNNTKYHNFFNGGEQARIHLVACVLESPFKK